jgi:hypothetical protein
LASKTWHVKLIGSEGSELLSSANTYRTHLFCMNTNNTAHITPIFTALIQQHKHIRSCNLRYMIRQICDSHFDSSCYLVAKVSWPHDLLIVQLFRIFKKN